MPTASCIGQDDAFRFDLQSKANGAEYTIEVVLPAGAETGDAKYPAIYCTDWFVLAEYLESLPKLMNMGRLTEPFIFVGISQPGDGHDWATARTRDFTPARPTDDHTKQHTYTSAIDQAGGALQFINFLKVELVPRIESDYPVDPSRRGFLGYSLGGLLGVQLLMSDPGFFDHYLLGSPSMWFNQYGLAFSLDDVPAERLAAIERLYLSVGEEESSEMLQGYGILRDALLANGFDGARAKMEIIDDAGHVGAMPISLYNGLRFLFSNE
jgi:predicted alpha/beta superfamily hydrolase